MKKPAFEGRANSVATTTILAPSCLIVDAAAAHLHLDLLHKDEFTTHLRAFPHKGGSMGARTGLFGQDLERFSEFNAEGRGIYLVVNNGGNSDNSITECVAFFVEWDDISQEKQLNIYKEKNLPAPTFQVNTGGKSIHNYWVLKKPVSQLIWSPIQKRLIDYTNSDKQIKNPSRVMRLAGFYHVKDGKPTEQSKLINITQSDWTLKEIIEALDHIPSRVTGNNTYEEYRNMAWGLTDLLEQMGHPESLAIQLLEAHSPSGEVSNWNVSQVVRGRKGHIKAGTFIRIAQKHGWKPKANESQSTRKFY